MGTLARESRELVRWAVKHHGFTLDERNSRYILRHDKVPHPIFVGANPGSSSAIPNAKSIIAKAIRQYINVPEAAAIEAPPPPPERTAPYRVATIETIEQQPEEPVMAMPRVDEDLIIRRAEDDTMRTGNANFDRFEIGKTVWSQKRRNEYTITGKEPFKKILLVVDKRDLNTEVRLVGDGWNTLHVTHPFHKFSVGKWFWDHQIHRWQVMKLNHQDYSILMEDQLGVKRTFHAHEIDDLRTTIDGANNVRDRKLAAGEPVPPVHNLATSKVFADKLAPLKNGNAQSAPQPEPVKQPEPVHFDPPLPVVVTTTTPTRALRQGFIEHEFQLRQGMFVYVELPADLNEADVKRLSRWIEALAF